MELLLKTGASIDAVTEVGESLQTGGWSPPWSSSSSLLGSGSL